ncbi:MAG: hypothetical protein H7240_00765 [Glaciimonas sp.]|nr:hypothetical protein [Glaciimonas sp.]
MPDTMRNNLVADFMMGNSEKRVIKKSNPVPPKHPSSRMQVIFKEAYFPFQSLLLEGVGVLGNQF